MSLDYKVPFLTWECVRCKLINSETCTGCGETPLPEELFKTQWSYSLPPEFIDEDSIMFMLIVVAKGCKKSFDDFKDAVFGYIIQCSIITLNLIILYVGKVLTFLIQQCSRLSWHCCTMSVMSSYQRKHIFPFLQTQRTFGSK